MTDPMSPADVPDDLVQVATRAMSDRKSPEGIGYAPDGWWEDDARVALAAVLPVHEQQVRERVAAELRKVTFRCPIHDRRLTFDDRCISCQRYAALVGAEWLILGQESASVKAVREMWLNTPAGSRSDD